MADEFELGKVSVDSPPQKPKKRSRVLDVVAVAVVLFAVAFAVYHRVPQFRTMTLAVAGRSPVCSLRQAMNSPEVVREHYERIDRVRSASRLVEDDAEGFELWETPQGEFWVPSGAAETMIWVVAKHESDMYDPPNLSVHPGDIVLDCGAHVGVFARQALAAGAEPCGGHRARSSDSGRSEEKYGRRGRRRPGDCLRKRGLEQGRDDGILLRRRLRV